MMLLTLVTTLLVSQNGSAAARIVVAAPYAPKDIVEALRTQTPITQRFLDGGRLLISGDLEVDLGVAEVGALARGHDVLQGHPVEGIRVEIAPGSRVRLVNREVQSQALVPTTDPTSIDDHVEIMGSSGLAEQNKTWNGPKGDDVPHTDDVIKRMFEFFNETIPPKPDFDAVTVTADRSSLPLLFIVHGISNDESFDDSHIKALIDRFKARPLPPCAKPLGDDSSDI